MEILFKTAFFVFLNILPILGAPSSTPTTTDVTTSNPSTKHLDVANLETLNRETRKALLTIVGNELATARAMMKSIEPEVNKCQRKVDQKYYDCVQCVDMQCQNRYKECNGDILITAPNSGGVSVSSSTNDIGLPVTTICTTILGKPDACSTIMNPDGAFASSISSMGDTLHIHLQSVARDLGGNVGMFVNQMQGVVGDMNSSVTDANIEMMLNELDFGLSGMQFELQNMFTGIGHDVQQSMAAVKNSVSQIGPRFGKTVQYVNPGIGMVQSGHRLANTGPHFRQQINSGINDMMGNFQQSFGQWRQNFGNSMNTLFSNLFGRKKRQAQIIANPSHEVMCDSMLKNSSVCAEYRTKCESCPKTSPANDKDVIRQVCGDVIVDQVMQIDARLLELAEIEQTVVITRQIIDQVAIDKTSWNPDTFAFNNALITAQIKGQPVKFSSKSALKIMDLPATGLSIAKQIWRYWNEPAVQKPY